MALRLRRLLLERLRVIRHLDRLVLQRIDLLTARQGHLTVANIRTQKKRTNVREQVETSDSTFRIAHQQLTQIKIRNTNSAWMMLVWFRQSTYMVLSNTPCVSLISFSTWSSLSPLEIRPAPSDAGAASAEPFFLPDMMIQWCYLPKFFSVMGQPWWGREVWKRRKHPKRCSELFAPTKTARSKCQSSFKFFSFKLFVRYERNIWWMSSNSVAKVSYLNDIDIFLTQNPNAGLEFHFSRQNFVVKWITFFSRFFTEQCVRASLVWRKCFAHLFSPTAMLRSRRIIVWPPQMIRNFWSPCFLNPSWLVSQRLSMDSHSTDLLPIWLSMFLKININFCLLSLRRTDGAHNLGLQNFKPKGSWQSALSMPWTFVIFIEILSIWIDLHTWTFVHTKLFNFFIFLFSTIIWSLTFNWHSFFHGALVFGVLFQIRRWIAFSSASLCVPRCFSAWRRHATPTCRANAQTVWVGFFFSCYSMPSFSCSPEIQGMHFVQKCRYSESVLWKAQCCLLARSWSFTSSPQATRFVLSLFHLTPKRLYISKVDPLTRLSDIWLSESNKDDVELMASVMGALQSMVWLVHSFLRYSLHFVLDHWVKFVASSMIEW